MVRKRIFDLAVATAWFALACLPAAAQNELLASAPDQGSTPASKMAQSASSSNASPSPTGRYTPRAPSRVLPQKPISIDDELAGITLSSEQKAKIDQVRKEAREHMNLVANDPKETADQKQAMIAGFQRLELRQVYLLLTADQRMAFRQKVMAQRAAEQQHDSSPQPQQK